MALDSYNRVLGRLAAPAEWLSEYQARRILNPNPSEVVAESTRTSGNPATLVHNETVRLPKLQDLPGASPEGIRHDAIEVISHSHTFQGRNLGLGPSELVLHERVWDDEFSEVAALMSGTQRTFGFREQLFVITDGAGGWKDAATDPDLAHSQLNKIAMLTTGLALSELYEPELAESLGPVELVEQPNSDDAVMWVLPEVGEA